jgi:hypothetical protein
VIDQDELRRLLNQTREHNIKAPRLTEAQYAALPNPNEVTLEMILDGDDRPDRMTLEHYVRPLTHWRAERDCGSPNGG